MTHLILMTECASKDEEPSVGFQDMTLEQYRQFQEWLTLHNNDDESWRVGPEDDKYAVSINCTIDFYWLLNLNPREHSY